MEKYGVKCGRDFVGVIRFGDFGTGAYFGTSNCRRLSSLGAHTGESLERGAPIQSEVGAWSANLKFKWSAER